MQRETFEPSTSSTSTNIITFKQGFPWSQYETSQSLETLCNGYKRSYVYCSSANVPKCHQGNYLDDIYVTQLDIVTVNIKSAFGNHFISIYINCGYMITFPGRTPTSPKRHSCPQFFLPVFCTLIFNAKRRKEEY